MSHADEAEAIFWSGLNCCQAVVMAYAREFGVDVEQARNLGSGFGGGMGGMGLTCGAVTGALMVIGLKYPRHDRGSAGLSAQAVKKFCRRFAKSQGSIICRDLIRYDLSTSAGQEAARAAGVLDTICPAAVRAAAEILDDMLEL